MPAPSSSCEGAGTQTSACLVHVYPGQGCHAPFYIQLGGPKFGGKTPKSLAPRHMSGRHEWVGREGAAKHFARLSVATTVET
jgi:hypothetical protein